MDQIPHVIAGAAGALAAAGGTGAATEFGKRLAGFGTEWLSERFGKSAQTAVEVAQKQGNDFIAELEQRVKRLEEAGELAPGQADAAFQRPDTLSALRLAYNAAAETADPVKRSVIATLVADRLKAAAESLEAVTSRRAIEVAPNVSPIQFRLLAQLVVVLYVRPVKPAAPAPWPWLEQRLQELNPLVVSYADAAYLESLGLLKYDQMMVTDLAPLIDVTIDSIRITATGLALTEAWDKLWKRTELTHVGKYLGVYAYDELTQGQTRVAGL